MVTVLYYVSCINMPKVLREPVNCVYSCRMCFVAWSTQHFARLLRIQPSTMIQIPWIQSLLRTKNGCPFTMRCQILMPHAYHHGFYALNSIVSAWQTRSLPWSRFQRKSLQVCILYIWQAFVVREMTILLNFIFVFNCTIFTGVFSQLCMLSTSEFCGTHQSDFDKRASWRIKNL